MNDEQALTALRQRLTDARDRLSDESMTIPASQIIARTTRRRRRRWLASGAAACATAGLAVALTVATTAPAHPAAPAHTQLAAWSVHTNKDGSVTFTLRETAHAAQLQRALSQAGVPAVVRWGEICQAVTDVSPGDSVQWGRDTPVYGGASSWFDVAGTGKKGNLDWTWTIYPDKVPRGAHFVISGLPGPVPPTQVRFLWEFVQIDSPISCVAHMKL